MTERYTPNNAEVEAARHLATAVGLLGADTRPNDPVFKIFSKSHDVLKAHTTENLDTEDKSGEEFVESCLLILDEDDLINAANLKFVELKENEDGELDDFLQRYENGQVDTDELAQFVIGAYFTLKTTGSGLDEREILINQIKQKFGVESDEVVETVNDTAKEVLNGVLSKFDQVVIAYEELLEKSESAISKEDWDKFVKQQEKQTGLYRDALEEMINSRFSGNTGETPMGNPIQDKLMLTDAINTVFYEVNSIYERDLHHYSKDELSMIVRDAILWVFTDPTIQKYTPLVALAAKEHLILNSLVAELTTGMAKAEQFFDAIYDENLSIEDLVKLYRGADLTKEQIAAILRFGEINLTAETRKGEKVDFEFGVPEIINDLTNDRVDYKSVIDLDEERFSSVLDVYRDLLSRRFGEVDVEGIYKLYRSVKKGKITYPDWYKNLGDNEKRFVDGFLNQIFWISKTETIELEYIDESGEKTEKVLHPGEVIVPDFVKDKDGFSKMKVSPELLPGQLNNKGQTFFEAIQGLNSKEFNSKALYIYITDFLLPRIGLDVEDVVSIKPRKRTHGVSLDNEISYRGMSIPIGASPLGNKLELGEGVFEPKKVLVKDDLGSVYYDPKHKEKTFFRAHNEEYQPLFNTETSMISEAALRDKIATNLETAIVEGKLRVSFLHRNSVHTLQKQGDHYLWLRKPRGDLGSSKNINGKLAFNNEGKIEFNSVRKDFVEGERVQLYDFISNDDGDPIEFVLSNQKKVYLLRPFLDHDGKEKHQVVLNDLGEVEYLSPREGVVSSALEYRFGKLWKTALAMMMFTGSISRLDSSTTSGWVPKTLQKYAPESAQNYANKFTAVPPWGLQYFELLTYSMDMHMRKFKSDPFHRENLTNPEKGQMVHEYLKMLNPNQDESWAKLGVIGGLPEYDTDEEKQQLKVIDEKLYNEESLNERETILLAEKINAGLWFKYNDRDKNTRVANLTEFTKIINNKMLDGKELTEDEKGFLNRGINSGYLVKIGDEQGLVYTKRKFMNEYLDSLMFRRKFKPTSRVMEDFLVNMLAARTEKDWNDWFKQQFPEQTIVEDGVEKLLTSEELFDRDIRKEVEELVRKQYSETTAQIKERVGKLENRLSKMSKTMNVPELNKTDRFVKKLKRWSLKNITPDDLYLLDIDSVKSERNLTQQQRRKREKVLELYQSIKSQKIEEVFERFFDNNEEFRKFGEDIYLLRNFNSDYTIGTFGRLVSAKESFDILNGSTVRTRRILDSLDFSEPLGALYPNNHIPEHVAKGVTGLLLLIAASKKVQLSFNPDTILGIIEDQIKYFAGYGRVVDANYSLARTVNQALSRTTSQIAFDASQKHYDGIQAAIFERQREMWSSASITKEQLDEYVKGVVGYLDGFTAALSDVGAIDKDAQVYQSIIMLFSTMLGRRSSLFPRIKEEKTGRIMDPVMVNNDGVGLLSQGVEGDSYIKVRFDNTSLKGFVIKSVLESTGVGGMNRNGCLLNASGNMINSLSCKVIDGQIHLPESVLISDLAANFHKFIHLANLNAHDIESVKGVVGEILEVFKDERYVNIKFAPKLLTDTLNYVTGKDEIKFVRLLQRMGLAKEDFVVGDPEWIGE